MYMNIRFVKVKIVLYTDVLDNGFLKALCLKWMGCSA